MRTKEELREQLEEAIELINQAQMLVNDVVDTDSMAKAKGHYSSYGRYGFDQLLSNGNPYDKGINSLLEVVDNLDE